MVVLVAGNHYGKALTSSTVSPKVGNLHQDRESRCVYTYFKHGVPLRLHEEYVVCRS